MLSSFQGSQQLPPPQTQLLGVLLALPWSLRGLGVTPTWRLDQTWGAGSGSQENTPQMGGTVCNQGGFRADLFCWRAERAQIQHSWEGFVAPQPSKTKRTFSAPQHMVRDYY